MGYFKMMHDFPTHLFMGSDRQDHGDLYIMRGIPGCGKSFRAKQLSERLGNAPVFSADNFFGEGEEYRRRWTPQTAHLGHRDCESKVLAAMKANAPAVIVDNTNIALQGFRTYLDYATDLDYAVYFVYPNSPWWIETVEPYLKAKKPHEFDREKAEEIAKLLASKTVHGVPEQTLVDMMTRFQWVTFKDYADATAQREIAVEKELAELRARSLILQRRPS